MQHRINTFKYDYNNQSISMSYSIYITGFGYCHSYGKSLPCALKHISFGDYNAY